MKRKRLLLMAFMMICLSILSITPGTALADTYRYSGQGAEAFFETQGTDGSTTSVFVFSGIFTSFAKPSSDLYTPLSGKVADVWILQHFPGDPDDEDDDIYRDITGYISPADIKIDKALKSASLVATLNADIWEYEGDLWLEEEAEPTQTTLNVSLSWIGKGPLSRSSSNNHYRGDGFFANSSSSDTSRKANAIGSIVDASGYDFISGIQGIGRIFKARSGETIMGDPEQQALITK